MTVGSVTLSCLNNWYRCYYSDVFTRMPSEPIQERPKHFPGGHLIIGREHISL